MKKLLIFTAFLSFSLFSFSQNRTLPKVDLKTLDNNTFNTSDFDNDGKPIVISFWATWCKPCIAEFESLEEVKDKFQDINVKIIAVSNEDLKLINSFLNKRKFDLDFIKLNGDLSYFNAYSLPTTIVFDKSGNEAFRLTGGVDFNTKNFIDRILNIEKL